MAPRAQGDDAGYPAALWLSVAAALAGSFTCGYQTAVLNTPLSQIKASLHYTHETLLVSICILGAALGAGCSGLLADWLGPRQAQLLGTTTAAGALLSAFASAQHPRGFLIGRLISGLGAGGASLYAPRYLAEIAPRQLRGRLVSWHQVATLAGILAALLMGLPYAGGPSVADGGSGAALSVGGRQVEWWRVMLLMGALPCCVQFCLLLAAPESPMWLELRHKERADESCMKLWGTAAVVYEEVPDEEAAKQMAALLELDEEAPAGCWALARREYRWMLCLALGLPLLQQACGINTVVLYSSEVFEGAGLPDPVYGSIIVGSVNLAFTAVNSAVIDRTGRRPLMLLSYAGMAGCCLLAALLFGNLPESALLGVATAATLTLFVLFYGLGAGPITWLAVSEVLPKSIKGGAASLATLLSWMGNLAVAATFSIMKGDLHISGTYAAYAALNVLALVAVYGLLPETKCKTWRELDALLRLTPKPKLRHMFPTPTARSEDNSAHSSKLQSPAGGGGMWAAHWGQHSSAAPRTPAPASPSTPTLVPSPPARGTGGGADADAAAAALEPSFSLLSALRQPPDAPP